MKYLLLAFLFLFVSCDDNGDIYVSNILKSGNKRTCKTVLYCKEPGGERKECETVQKGQLFLERVLCVDLANDSYRSYSMDDWEDVKGEYVQFNREDFYLLLENEKYIMENTSIYQDLTPEIIQGFIQFHELDN